MKSEEERLTDGNELRRPSAEQITQLQGVAQRFHTLTVSAPVGIFLDDAQGNAIYINEKCAELIGVPMDQALGLDWVPLIHPDDRERVTTRWAQAVASGETYCEEYRWVHSDGTVVWTLGNVVPVREEGGEASLFIGTLTDITDRKRAESALRKQRDRLDLILKTTLEGYILAEDSGNILDVNPAYCAMIGYSRDELLSMNVRQLEASLSEKEFLARVKLMVSAGGARFETKHRHQDGHEVDLDVNCAVMQSDGRSLVAAFVRDLSEKKLAEVEADALRLQLTQSSKLDSIGRLAGGVAHDFNNMLSIILGQAELTLEDVETDSPVAKSLWEIREAAQRSAELTYQLLAFARKQPVSPRILDLNETIADMLGILRRLIGENIDLSWRPADDLWPIEMDPSQIHQVLTNLCVNARDAILGTGSIQIEVRNVAEGEACERASLADNHTEFVELIVRDNGCGMEEEILGNAFEPFFTTKEPGLGTGLGLSTVHGIIEQNHGFIKFDTGTGTGTTVRVFIPRQKGSIADHNPRQHALPARDRSQVTILVAEDNQSILRMTMTMLASQGYVVLGASSPTEALHLVEDNRSQPDLLLTDVVMPKMLGSELARKLRILVPELRVLYMSGFAIEDSGTSLESPYHLLRKPFTHSSLERAIKSALDS